MKLVHGLLVGVLGFYVTGCTALSPVPRLDQYLRPAGNAGPDPARIRSLQGAPLDAGLVVIHDAAGNRADPAVLQQSKSFLTDQTPIRVESNLPIKFMTVLEGTTSDPGQALDSWGAQLREKRLEYLMVALFSNEQTDSHDTMMLDGNQEGGGAMGRVQGITTTNFALAELAFLSITEKGTDILARADGRAFANFERLENGLESNAYPSIRRSGRSARIVPPADEAMAKDVLRGLGGLDAMEQAVNRLMVEWKKSAQQ